jgi:hypothetical protein
VVERARCSAEWRASVQLALRPAQPEASAEPARRRAEPEVSAERVPQRAAQVVSAQQAVARLPEEGWDAAAVRLPVADAAGAPPGVEAVELPLEAPAGVEAERVVSGQRAGAQRASVAQVAPALPLAALSALAFRRDRLRSVPALQPAVRFARAMAGL